MRIFTKQQLQEALATLSPELQDLVLSDTINFPLVDAMRDAGLSVAQRAQVGTSATCVILGLATVDEFARSLTTEVGLTSDIAQTLAQNIEQNVFRLVKEVVKPPSTSQSTSEQPRPTRAGVLGTIRTTRADRVRVGAPDMTSIFSNTQRGAHLMFGESIDSFILDCWHATPNPISNAIIDHDYKMAVRNAINQYVLSADSVFALEEEVLMTLLGLQSKADFTAYLPSITGLTQNDAKHIAEHIETHFFALLSPYLDKIADNDLLITVPPRPPLSEGEDTKNSPPPAERSAPIISSGPLEQFVNKQPDVLARFQKLPEGVRNAILSDNVAQAFSNIVRTHNLTQEHFVAVGNEAVRVMVGLATTKDFRARMSEQNLVDPTATEVLARAIEQEMFKPVRDAIVEALEERKRTNP